MNPCHTTPGQESSFPQMPFCSTEILSGSLKGNNLPFSSKTSRSLDFVARVGELAAIYKETFSASSLSNLCRISSPCVVHGYFLYFLTEYCNIVILYCYIVIFLFYLLSTEGVVRYIASVVLLMSISFEEPQHKEGQKCHLFQSNLTEGGKLQCCFRTAWKTSLICRRSQAMSLGVRPHSQPALCHMCMRKNSHRHACC